MAPSDSARPLRIGIIAGEASGDVLAAGLIHQIKQLHPDAIFEGIAGVDMLQEGCHTLFDMEELSVMGLVEVLSNIRRLLHIRKSVLHHFTQTPPDIFIGVDAPDFNLPLEKKLKDLGIKTVHYVSPTVWAWREKRIFGIGAATNLVLSIFPFEKQVYDKYGFPCEFVGHTMADNIPMHPDQQAARDSLSQLSIAENAKVLGILPGSRSGEVNMLMEIFLSSAKLLASKVENLHVIIPAVNEVRKSQIERLIASSIAQDQSSKNLKVSVVLRQSRDVLIASDAILLASGTASLEAMLCKRPMVVAYRLKWFTHQLMKKLYKAKFFALPNLLADEKIVPELLQEDVNADNIAEHLLPMLSGDTTQVTDRFMELHSMLKQNADVQAANAVLALLDK